MRVTLLGTGDAAGWPQPFCRCASCNAAHAEGIVRAHTSVLVDEVLLLDCGSDVPRSAARLGVVLDRVRFLFITHDHHDHASGAALLWRQWAQATQRTQASTTGQPLDVFGPAAALDALAPWLPPDGSNVHLRPMHAGDTVTFDRYTVRAFAADHDSAGALLYDVTDDAGAHLLYATDTGPGFELPAAARYDLVLLEETWGARPPPGSAGHHDLTSFPTTLARLRKAQLVDDATDVVAVHLGHGNPPPRRLAEQLAEWGARMVPDGTTLEIGARSNATNQSRGRHMCGPQPQRILVLGGARSGKSRTAERLLAADPTVDYVATSAADAADPEWVARIAAHRARRPTSWSTTETIELAALLRTRDDKDPAVLIDCVTLWLARVMDACGVWSAATDCDSERADAMLADEVDTFVEAWRSTRARVVAVTNEVGAGVVPEHSSGRRFRDELGSLNARLAATADDVLLVTAGIAQSLLASRASATSPTWISLAAPAAPALLAARAASALESS